MAIAHPSDDGPVLDVHLPCNRCSYDLISRHIFAKCPECGLEVIASVAEHHTPEVAQLAAPESPKEASKAVIAITMAPLAAVVIQGSGPALRAIDALAGRGSAFPSQVERPSWLISALVLAAAAVIAHRGLSEASNPTLRASFGAARVKRLVFGISLWSVVLAAGFVVSLMPNAQGAEYPKIVLSCQLFPIAFTMIALAPVLARAGAISRVYREARHGRQGAELLSVTLVSAITLYVAAKWIEVAQYEEIAIIALLLAAVLMVLSVLGLAYVTANGWVIAAALRMPRIDPSRLR